MLVTVAVHAPAYLRRAWSSLVAEAQATVAAAHAGHVADLIGACAGAVLLVLPVVAMSLTFLLLCRRAGTRLALAGHAAALRPPPVASPRGAGAPRP